MVEILEIVRDLEILINFWLSSNIFIVLDVVFRVNLMFENNYAVNDWLSI